MRHAVLYSGNQYIFETENNVSVSFTHKRHAFNIFVNPGENLWTFDLEGRLMGMFFEGKNIRRTLDNRFYLKTRELIGLDVFRTVRELSQIDYEKEYEKGREYLEEYQIELPDDVQKIASKILEWDLDKLNKQANEFTKVYKPISILPPDQYLALVVQITEGCSYNKCAFCNFYRDRKFKIKSVNAIEEHLLSIKEFIGEGIHVRRSIFLGDANALIIPQNQLIATFYAINHHYPYLTNIYSFIDVYTGIMKTCDDFAALAQMGLKRVYLGVETGNPELLELLNKPRIDSNLHKLVFDLKQGGIDVGIIFLAGIGGNTFADKHVQDSIKLVDQLSLSAGDIVYVSEYYNTNPEYQKVVDDAGVEGMNRKEIRRQANYLRQQLKYLLPKQVKISVYDIQQFFY